MKRFCVITNKDKDDKFQEAGYICEFLESRGGSCRVIENKKHIHRGICHFTDADDIPQDTECVLVLGGDGTMIQAAIDLMHRKLPILGINIGTVGFLTEVEKKNMDQALEMLLNDDYTKENRIMLQGKSLLKGKEPAESELFYALNDVVLSKRGSCRLITIKVYINEELADIYSADGLIVSTPTGSTGYNLSAGGPVMVPHSQATVITPVCPHSLNKRSLVVSAEDHIRLELGQTKEFVEDTANLFVDGRNVQECVTGDGMDLLVSDEITQLIKLSGISFYKRMRDKLNGN